MNKVFLIGRLGADPELRSTAQGKPVANFNIAVDRKFKNADGTKETDWFTIVAWNQLADLCSKYLAKGRQVAVDGRIQTRSYENKEGQTVRVFEIVADNVQFLDRSGDQGYSPTANESMSDMPSSNKTKTEDPFANKDAVIDISDDDLPF